MKIISQSILILAVAIQATSAIAQDPATEKATMLKFTPGKQVANQVTIEIDGEEPREIGFWIYTPANYEEVETMPWMMFLHGMGERGDDLELVKKWGPPKLVSEQEDFPFILISPQCPDNIKWQTQHLIQILNRVQEEMKVDTKRLYMTGLSMGGYGTWSMTAAIPERIAASIPVCGGGNVQLAEKMIDVPIWAFHGDADNVVTIRRSQEMVDAVNAASGNAKLTTYEGVGHNSWSETYANAEIYDWFLSHTTDR